MMTLMCEVKVDMLTEAKRDQLRLNKHPTYDLKQIES